MNATYQGNPVGSSSISVGPQTSTIISANIYSVTASVVDSRNHPFAGASIAVTLGNYTVSGVTDNDGMFPFHAVGNAIYNATVTYGDQIYFSGPVGAQSNNAVIVLRTSYLAPTFQLIILALAAAVPISGVAAYLVARRLKKSR
jgi:hypothetical protein